MGTQRHSKEEKEKQSDDAEDMAMAVALALADDDGDDDDDFQMPPYSTTQSLLLNSLHRSNQRNTLLRRSKPKNPKRRSPKKIKTTHHINLLPAPSIPLLDITNIETKSCLEKEHKKGPLISSSLVSDNPRDLHPKDYLCKGSSIESRLLGRGRDHNSLLQNPDACQSSLSGEAVSNEFNETQHLPSQIGTQMNALLQLCCDTEEHEKTERDRSDVNVNKIEPSFSGGEEDDISSLLTQAPAIEALPLDGHFNDEGRVCSYTDGKDEEKLVSSASLNVEDRITNNDAHLSRNSSPDFVQSTSLGTDVHSVSIQQNNSTVSCERQNAEFFLDENGLIAGPQMVTAEVESFPKRADELVQCPVCGLDISNLNALERQTHTNDCLDKEEVEKVISNDYLKEDPCKSVFDVAPVLRWLEALGLSRYSDIFIREEIDWDTLRWLTEDDLSSLGITAFGPRRKIAQALQQLRSGCNEASDNPGTGHRKTELTLTDSNQSKESGTKLITEYFPGSSVKIKRQHDPSPQNNREERQNAGSSYQKRKKMKAWRGHAALTGIPDWLCIPGTSFRVDAFRYLRGDCSHWFLSHFHADHYQGLTKGFRYGKVYCSLVTARLVNMRIGVPWDRLHALPLNERINIDGVYVTFIDANHCPGSVIILFEPPNGKPVLHTGDFRFCHEMIRNPILDSCNIHTVILDTTYCNPQYDFPKQESVIQFVLEAIQAEAFNPRTLFLIGTYTIGKERIFLEVARVLRKKVYVGAAKLRLLECMGFPPEDMQWLTSNEDESHIHVVPLWSIANFKRMNFISKHYHGRYNSIVAFSPTGWTFGKGKKKTPGKRWQQGTLIRYEVPYSEHCSFTELKEFVKFIAPEIIVPSVNNNSAQAANNMISLLLSD